LGNGLVDTITEVLKPQAPLWACELTLSQVILAGVKSGRKQIAAKVVSDVPPGKKVEGARTVVRDLIDHAGFKGSEIAVIVPDETARIAFLTAETPSKTAEEQRTFIRWKLKKTIPFDVDTAQVAYRILGPHRSGGGVDILVALSPRSVIEEYEALFNSLDIHAGLVVPSTLAVLNLFNVPAADTLFVKVAPDCITTTVFQNRRVQFYRRVTETSLYNAVHPTILYHQDKLNGKAIEHLCVCGHGLDLRTEIEEVQEKLGLVAHRLEPRAIDDIFKPALGAIHLKPEGVA
jgi:type IV pilus assembly protein PilM